MSLAGPLGRMSQVRLCIPDPRQNFHGAEDESPQYQQERKSVRVAGPVAPGPDRAPDATDDDHGHRREIRGKPRPASRRIRPHDHRHTERDADCQTRIDSPRLRTAVGGRRRRAALPRFGRRKRLPLRRGRRGPDELIIRQGAKLLVDLRELFVPIAVRQRLFLQRRAGGVCGNGVNHGVNLSGRGARGQGLGQSAPYPIKPRFLA